MNSILAWQSPYGDDTFFEKPLAQIGTYTVAELQERRARALTEEFVAGMLLSPAGDLALASVRLGSATLTAEQRLATAEATLALRDSLQSRHPDVGVHVSSEALYELSSREAMLDDLLYLLPIVLLLCNGSVLDALLLWRSNVQKVQPAHHRSCFAPPLPTGTLHTGLQYLQ